MKSLPGYSDNTANYDLYYDFHTHNVLLSTGIYASSGDPTATSASANIPCTARFFSIRFTGWTDDDLTKVFDPSLFGTVVNVSVMSKAYELSSVIKAITQITYVKDVVIVAHSLGALDSRTYIQGLGTSVGSDSSTGPCQSTLCPVASNPVSYNNDVGELVTLDGANAGSGIGDLLNKYLGIVPFPINVEELKPERNLLLALSDPGFGYKGSDGDYVYANDLTVPATSVVDVYRNWQFDCITNPAVKCGGDGAVTIDSQSLNLALMNVPDPDFTKLPDNTFDVNDPTILKDANCGFTLGSFNIEMLHLLHCLADQHSSDYTPSSLVYAAIEPNTLSKLTTITVKPVDRAGNPYTGPINLTLQGPGGAVTLTQSKLTLIGPSVPVSGTVPYSLTYNSGGPSGAGTPTITATDEEGNPCVNCHIQPGNWSITFNVVFNVGTPALPSATTGGIANIQRNGATLTGAVNPNGGATAAWFEWGLTGALGRATAKQPAGNGNGAISLTAGLTGLSANTGYYYRLDASNIAGTSHGIIQSFITTLLPAPTPVSPGNGATGVSTVPGFTWSGVSGATSYRILVATSASALPTDPAVGTCGAGCVVDDTTGGTSYTPAPGILSAGTKYYWEVHARSPQQFGAWSTIWSFTPGQSSLASLEIGPSNPVANGSWTTITATLSGPAPSGGATVALSSSSTSAYPVPASIVVQEGGVSASASVQTGTVKASTAVAVTGLYNKTQTATLTIDPSGGTITSGSATGITSTWAKLSGTVNTGGVAGYVWFNVGTDQAASNLCAPGAWNNLVAANTSNQSFSLGTDAGSQWTNCLALSSGTTYHYQGVFYNSNNGEYKYGAIQSFTTHQ